MNKINALLFNASNGSAPLAVTPAGSGGITRTPSIASLTGTSSITAGARSATLYLSSNFAGTVAGGTVSGAVTNVLTIKADGQADTLAAIPYAITTGTITALTVR